MTNPLPVPAFVAMSRVAGPACFSISEALKDPEQEVAAVGALGKFQAVRGRPAQPVPSTKTKPPTNVKNRERMGNLRVNHARKWAMASSGGSGGRLRVFFATAATPLRLDLVSRCSGEKSRFSGTP
jgi:hypothetical protein